MSVATGLLETFSQEEGDDVRLRALGDEFYARYETASGHAAIYDGFWGRWCYATLDGGEYLSTGIPVTEPPPLDLPLHLVESPAVRARKFDQALGEALPPDAFNTPDGGVEVFGPNKGLLNGRQTNVGKVRGLTILVNFQDVQAAIPTDEVHALLNTEGYSAYGNACSVRDYYRRMSSGMLDFSNLVIGPITLSQNRQYYIDNPLMSEALDAAVELLIAEGIDMAQFDSREEGILDAVSFFYAGETRYEGKLWPHNHYLDWSHDGYSTSFYQISSLGLQPSQLKIGTFAHECGHMLCRFPDLYDYGRRDDDFLASAGLGQYCLMSAGNHLNGGKTPSPICAYLRYLTGWITEEVDLRTPGQYTARHGDYGRYLKYNTGRDNEYFLIENRSRTALDTHLPSSGLSIYHCDILGSNEWQGNTADKHYQCMLLQADKLGSLERNENQGDEGDLYNNVAGDVLSDASVPNTLTWDGSASGLRIRDIGAAGDEITFTIH